MNYIQRTIIIVNQNSSQPHTPVNTCIHLYTWPVGQVWLQPFGESDFVTSHRLTWGILVQRESK